MCVLKVSVYFTIGLSLKNIGVCSKLCDGGHSCSGSMSCCNKGCCYTNEIGVSGAPQVYTVLLPAHWYFWALLAACLAAIICLCALWRRRSLWLCCSDAGQDRRSEPDSSGSCYAPPHYSRCSSFHHAPPPYTEVATKPDMYPLVISYAVGCEGNHLKTPPASYLMVQYFRNYICQPAGSLSAASTVDSLSSSFICNATNEANTIIPPPYSCTGSLDECSISVNDSNVQDQCLTVYRSDSATSCGHLDKHHHDNSSVTQNVENSLLQQSTSAARGLTPIYKNIDLSNTTFAYVQNKPTSFVSSDTSLGEPNAASFPSSESMTTANNAIRASSPAYVQPCESICFPQSSSKLETTRVVCSAPPSQIDNNPTNASTSSAAYESGPTRSDAINTNNLTDFSGHMEYEPHTSMERSYSVANSITGSDISSLANLGTPDSPPRATSPTVEIRELLDKIQQLPQQRSPTGECAAANRPPQQTSTRTKRYFTRNKIKTLYMPLNKSKHSTKTISIFDVSAKSTKGWLSRSAPTTPCANFIPAFPSQRKGSTHHSRRNSKTGDGSPLLHENDVSDDERKPERV